MRKWKICTLSFISIIAMLLTGCSGGGSGGSSTSVTNNVVNTPVASQTVSGVAATGAPISGTIYLKDSSNPAVELSTPINADGTFSFDVSGLTAPFILKAVGNANGQNYTLYSFAGAHGIANVNPLSHLAVVQANSGVDPASLYAAPTSAQMQAIKTALATVIPQIQTLLQQALSQYGVATTNFISDTYAANHLGLDLLFDMIAIVVNNGNLTVTNMVNGGAILTTTLNGNTLSGQVVTANIPTIATQSVGAVYVYPTSSSVATGSTVTFKAIVLGTNNQSVTWSVVEAGGGSITSAGVYTAPATAGTYHVRATSAVDSSKSGTAAVTAIPSESGATTPVNGLMGGAVQGKNLSLANTVVTVAGSPSQSGSTDGSGSSARFDYPCAITTDGTNLYVVDANNFTIRKIVISTGAVTTIAGLAGQADSKDGSGSAARFKMPIGITTDGTNLYVTDRDNSFTVRKIVISTGAVTTLAGSSGQTGSTDGIGSSAKFIYPNAITTDGTSLYVVDGNAIRKIVISSGAVTTIAGSTTLSGTNDGTGSSARFSVPIDITTDGTNLYVTEGSKFVIRKVVISTGVVTTIASASTSSASGLDFYSAITTDGTNLYVAGFDSTIRKIVISSGVVTTIAGSSGVSGSTDGSGSSARFGFPYGITTDGNHLYVNDTYNNTIREIQ